MTLAARIVKAAPRTKFEEWLAALSPEHSAIVINWLNDPDVANARIANAIRDDDDADDFTGYPASGETVAAWRRTHGVR